MARPKKFTQPKKVSFQVEQSQFDSLIKGSSVSDVLQKMVKFYIRWKWLERLEGLISFKLHHTRDNLRTLFFH